MAHKLYKFSAPWDTFDVNHSRCTVLNLGTTLTFPHKLEKNFFNCLPEFIKQMNLHEKSRISLAIVMVSNIATKLSYCRATGICTNLVSKDQTAGDSHLKKQAIANPSSTFDLAKLF